MKKSLLLFMVILTVSSGLLYSLEITLDSAAALALGNNRSLQAKYLNLKTLDRNRKSGWNEFFPDLYAGTNLTRKNQTFDTSPLPEFQGKWHYSFTVGAIMDLSAMSVYNIGASRLAWEQGQIGINEYEHSLVKNARKSFLELLLLRDTIKIYEKMIATAEDNYNKTNKRYELGDVRKVDMLSAKVYWQNMIPQLINIKNNFEIRKLEFKRLLGLPEDEDISLSGEFVFDVQEWNADELINNYLNKRFDVQYARKTIERLKNEKARRISETMTPSLSVGYTYMPTMYNVFDSNSTDFQDYMGRLNIGIILPLDGFIPNSRKNLKVKEMNESIEAANFTLKDTLQAGVIDIQSAVENLNKAAATIAPLELNVSLAEENYKLISMSYDVGEADYIQLQNADDDLNTAKLQLLKEKFSYISALEDLNYAIASRIEVKPVKYNEK